MEAANGGSTLLWTGRDVAKRLAMSPRKVWELTKRGILPAVRLGKRMIRYRPAEIASWVDSLGSTLRAHADGQHQS